MIIHKDVIHGTEIAFWHHTTKQNEIKTEGGKNTKKRRDHSEAKRWTVNNEILRGRSKTLFWDFFFATSFYVLLCSAAVDPFLPSLSAIPPIPPLPPFIHSLKSAHRLLSSGFVLCEQPCFTLRTQWAFKTISGTRNRCGKIHRDLIVALLLQNAVH